MKYRSHIELVLATAAFGSAVVVSARLSAHYPVAISDLGFLNRMAGHQTVLLLLAAMVFTYCRLRGLSRISLGRSNAVPKQPLGILGISVDHRWERQALSLLAKVAIPTAVFMVAGIASAQQVRMPSLFEVPWVLLFACTNAVGEEMVFRYLPVCIGHGQLPPRFVAVVSAVLFGLAHYGGAPGGPIGMIMSGILGYVLAIATIDTLSLRIAVLIHIVLDVIILTSILFMGLAT
jgi:uncharacterized protein